MATAFDKKAPRVPPSPSSMAARAAAAPANQQSRTQAAEFALFYQRLSLMNVDLDNASFSRTVPGVRPVEINLWSAVRSAAEMAMCQEPATMSDVLLQIGLCASWIGTVADAIDENDTARATVLAVATAVENATLFLCRGIPADQLSPELGALVEELVEQASLSGAEVAA